jgi:signal transduction histidine kinase
MANAFLAIPPFVAAFSACALVVGRVRTLRRPGGETPRTQPQGGEAEMTATRRMRVASHDLRAIGMILHGNADHLAAAGLPQALAIAAAAADVFEMADDLHEYTMQASATRVLADDEILLPVAMDDALNTVIASIGPGRRVWRISPDLSATRLRADRRALRYMLTHVLTAAVRNTHYNDAIDIALEARDDGLALVIENEGPAMMERTSAEAPAHDSRGLSLRLTLVRDLMRAHGGHADVDSQVGGSSTRVCLVFPAGRVLQSAIDHSRSHAAAPEEAEIDAR